MSKTNIVTLTGRLGADPRINNLATKTGRVANIFVATNRPDYKDTSSGEWKKRDPRWNNVAVFIPKAVDFLASCKKGDPIEVRCSVGLREHTDDAGVVRKETVLVCDSIFEGHLVKAWNPSPDRAAKAAE